jgi:hypothetical protein
MIKQTINTLKKMESGDGWIEYTVVIITAAKSLAAVITVVAYSIKPLPLSSIVVVIKKMLTS